MRTNFTLLLLFLVSVLKAQDNCAFDHYHEHQLSIPGYAEAEHEFNFRTAQFILNRRNSPRVEDLVVPVVVHIIHQNGDENISDEQVEIAIEQMNYAFANEGPYFLPTGIDTHIRFCLAGTDPNGDFTTGINRVQNALTTTHVPSDDVELKDLIRWDTEKYMNIWVVKEIIRDPNQAGVIGYATFPTAHGSNVDGIVCEAAYFGIDDTQSKVHTHEAGHYLGLYHTFQDGCPNNDCLLNGDRVCDTPPDNVTFSFLCYGGTNSCTTDEDDLSENNPFRPVALGGIGDQVDKQDDFMDYTNLGCFRDFTLGQAERMTAVLELTRASLLEGDRCVTPCSTPFAAQVIASDESTIVGDPIIFTAVVPAGVQVVWYVNDVESSTSQIFQFPADNEGVFEVVAELTNAEPGCKQEHVFSIEVNCPITATFPFDGNSYPPNTSLTFEGSNDGITTHTWLVNGEAAGNATTLNYTFSNSGVNIVSHTVSNGLCSDTYIVTIMIGTCFSGRESNLMYWNNGSGQAFGFNFNESGSEIYISEQPDFESNGGHNRATLSNELGELMYYADGQLLYDRNFDPLQNGNVIANPTAYQGSLFINVPESEDLVYYFSSAASPWTQGLRYSIIDNNLNNGLGGVTDVKNVFIEVTGSECYRSIQHCNMVDFWLVYYDGLENEFHAHLVNSDGISSEPVVSEIDLSYLEQVQTAPLVVNDEGSRLFIRGAILNFNQATGEVELALETVFDELVFAYCFSNSGKYAYFAAGYLNTGFYRIDLSQPQSEWLNNVENFANTTVDYFGVGMMAAPNGIVYYESISGWLSAVTNPEEENISELNFELEFEFIGAMINTFPNYHHAYSTGPTLYPQGPIQVCAGETHTYSVSQSECSSQNINWELEGSGELVSVSNGIITFTAAQAGDVKLIVSTELTCGLISDTLNVVVMPGIEIDLGSDVGFCAGQSLTLSPGPGYDNYTWQDGSSMPVFTVNQPGVYSVEVSLNGCSAADEIVVGPSFAGNIDLGPDVFLCDGEIAIIDAGPNFDAYVWHDGTSGQFFTAYEAGIVYVTSNTPCFATDTLLVTDCDQTIDNVTELNAFGDYLFPNPARDALTVRLGSNASGMEIFDAQGRLVHVCGQSRVGINEISVSHLESGVYMVVVNGERTRSMRFVKTD
ncbi:MAG: T9SS type A sorting domain-containing protein [Cryomorphaceae bacterium]|nr:T9SS type A sorting domain-containing protein [Cryomorphaceae bacterium]